MRYVVEAVPGADITVVRLPAPVHVLEARIRGREAGRDPDWYVNTAVHLAQALERAPVEDHMIDTVDRSARKVAAEALRLAGWLELA